MRIEIGKYVITSDSRNVILNEKTVVKAGDHAGDEALHAFAFCNSIEHACKTLLQVRVCKSDATTLKEIIEEIRLFKKEIDEMVK